MVLGALWRGLIITAFSVVSSECSSVVAATDSTLCRDLCRYRDVELYRQYDAAFTKYQLSAEERTKLNGMRQDLLSNPQWSTTDSRLASAELLVIVKMTCDLMTAAIKLNPAASLSTRAVSLTRLRAADVVKDAVKGVKVVRAAVDEGAEASAYKQIIAEFNPLLSAIKALDDFKAGIDKMQQLGIDRDNLRIEVTRILDMVSANIEKHNHIMKNNAMRLEDINQVVRGIDDFLLSNACERYCTNSQSDAVARKAGPTGAMKDSPPAVVEALGPGQIYVFFTLQIKDAIVFSRPIRANGFEDPLTLAKEQFEQTVKVQLPHLWSDEKKASSAYQRDVETMQGAFGIPPGPELKHPDDGLVKINYAAPWSREILRTPSAVDAAIKAYEQERLGSGGSGSPRTSFHYIK